MIITKEQKTYEILGSHMTRDISDLMLNSSKEVFMYFIHEPMINERICSFNQGIFFQRLDANSWSCGKCQCNYFISSSE